MTKPLIIRSHSTDELPPLESKTALAIGKFDGCHRGHQRLIAEIRRLSERGLTPTVLTFDPYPEAVLASTEQSITPLFGEDQKLRALAELGVGQVVVQTFDKALANTNHEDFYEDFLRKRLRAEAMVVGGDFRFGKRRLGTIDYLKNKANASGWDLIVVERNSGVSSSTVRRALAEEGDVARAKEMLGRPYLLEGWTVRGDQMGRQLGFPTLNLAPFPQLLPKTGVYAGHLWLQDSNCEAERPTVMQRPNDLWPAAINVGVRPTLNSREPTLRIEAHVLTDFPHQDCYDRGMGIYFEHRLREEQKYAGLDELKLAIATDIQQAKDLIL